MAIKVYFGMPGAGKTTHAAKIVYRNLKQGMPTFSNVYIKGAYLYSPVEDLGVYNIRECDIILDESAIEYNSRSFKSMPKTSIEFFKLYRHFKVRDVYVYSQAPDDMDLTIRRLASEFYLLQKSFIPGFSYSRRIIRNIGEIDPNTHQLTDGYQYVPFSRRYIWRRRYYAMFDSWTAPDLPVKQFTLCGGESQA